MKHVARRHHYNPRLLLAGFTPSGRKNDHLWVFDAVLTKVQRRTPKAVAWEMDYYTVDVPGEPPDVVEQVFGRIEAVAAPVLRESGQNEALPTGENLVNLMYFLALMYVRGPQWRKLATSLPEQVAQMSLRMALSTPERWEAAEEAMRKAGISDHSVPYESMRAYMEREGYNVRLANPGPVHVKSIADSLQFLPRLLGQRHWCLLVAEDDAGDFVSSDCPVTLVWTDPEPARLAPPGLGYLDTEVAMALNRRLALVGRYEPISDKVPADKWIVADINARTARFARRYVYGPSDDFTLLGADGQLLTSASWFAARAASGGQHS